MDLINLDETDDNLNLNLFSDNGKHQSLGLDKIKEDSGQVSPLHDAVISILNEEIDTQNLPASPPFTKISAIKIYSTSALNDSVVSAAVADEGRNENENENGILNKTEITSKLARKDHTRSFLPRVKKHQK